MRADALFRQRDISINLYGRPSAEAYRSTVWRRLEADLFIMQAHVIPGNLLQGLGQHVRTSSADSTTCCPEKSGPPKSIAIIQQNSSDLSEILYMRTVKHVNKIYLSLYENTGQLQFY